jgi:hypothetical protein
MLLAVGTFAQKRQTRAGAQAGSETSASASRGNKSSSIQSGTHLAGQLQSTLDAGKTRVGDQVILKTTESIKSNGQVVVNKGARLIGHVTSVEQKTRANGESQVGILFDRLESGSSTMPISATISSITQARAHAQNNDDMFGADMSTTSRSSSTTQRAPASGGGRGNSGLLGGAANTVGGVTSTATSVVGGVASTTTSTAGDTTAGLGRSLGRIQVTESSSTSAEGSSLLSLRGDNLRLEKGTTFNLVVNQSANVGAGRSQ